MRLRLRDTVLEFARGRPLIMGIMNATPDSFSDGSGPRAVTELVERANALVRSGAAIVDVGGESGRTDTEAISCEEEIERVVPLVGRLVADGLLVSVDTWRAEPARAALEAGAAMINDVSGLSDPVIAELCTAAGAGLVITHTRVAPKTKAFPAYDDVVADVLDLLRERSGVALEAGMVDEQLLLDPGFDLAKTPAESVELLRRVRELEVLGRPLLLALSRKDFVGALTGRLPAGRDAGTLGALEPALDLPGAVVRMHDVAGAVDFLRVRGAVRGQLDPPDGPLEDSLRREVVA
jgi:dihydropteroate synthase